MRLGMPLQAHKGGSITKDGLKLRTMTWQGNIAKALALKAVRDTRSAASANSSAPHIANPAGQNAASLPPRPPETAGPKSHAPSRSSIHPSDATAEQQGPQENAAASESGSPAPWRSSRVQLQKAASFNQEAPPSPVTGGRMRHAASGGLGDQQNKIRPDASSSTGDLGSCHSEAEFASCQSEPDTALAVLDESTSQLSRPSHGEFAEPDDYSEGGVSIAAQQAPATQTRSIIDSYFGAKRPAREALVQPSVAEIADEPMLDAALPLYGQPSVADLRDEPPAAYEAYEALFQKGKQHAKADQSSFSPIEMQPESPAESQNWLSLKQWLPEDKPLAEEKPASTLRKGGATSVYDVSRIAGSMALTQVLAGVLHANILGTEPAGKVLQAIRQKLLSKLQALQVRICTFNCITDTISAGLLGSPSPPAGVKGHADVPSNAGRPSVVTLIMLQPAWNGLIPPG